MTVITDAATSRQDEHLTQDTVTAEARSTAVGDPARLAAVRATALLDTPAEAAFDRLTRLATRILAAPVALVSLVDGDRDFWKSCIGVPEPFAAAREIRLKPSLCQHAITSRTPLVIDDATLDPTFASFPSVTRIGVRAYLGIPLVTEHGEVLGSFCVLDMVPRKWTPDEVSWMTDLAAAATTEIELRASVRTATNLATLLEQRAVQLEHQTEEAHAISKQLEQSNVDLEQANQELEQANEKLMSTWLALEERTEEAEYAHQHVSSALTAAQAARAAAEEANLSKSSFLATMSHELRTPLNAISGHVQLIEMGIHGPVTPKQQEALNRVMRAQHYLLGLINDVLNFAKLESGTVVYELEPVVLSEVIADVTGMIELQIKNKGLTFEVRSPTEDVVVLADREKLLQILINLLSNAIKFTPAGGHVMVEVPNRADGSQADGVVFVRVTDTGMGIGEDKLASVFEPFVQVSVTNVTRREGTGLGLSISRELARGMNGDLRARSTPGVGSTFTTTLRRAAPESVELLDRPSHEEERGGNDLPILCR